MNTIKKPKQRIIITRLCFLFLVSLFLNACSQTKQQVQTKQSTMENSSKTNPYYSRTDKTKLNISNEEWERILPPDLYAIAREANTERPFTGKYNEFDELGEYYCAVCGNHLFRSDSKFSSTCGWSSFFEAEPDGVVYKEDYSHGMIRTEVLCKRCDSHLGHIFDDGPKPTGKRFCMNSISLEFVGDSEKE